MALEPFQSGSSFVDHLRYLCIVLSCFCVCSLLPYGHLLGKGLTSWFSFVLLNCVFVTFPCCILGQVWNLIASIPDLCPLSYFISYFCLFGLWFYF